MDSLPESDWKVLRSVKDAMLAIACERILKQADSLLADRAGHEHERYMALWELMREEDKDIAFIFDDMRRSKALFILMAMRSRGLMSDDVFSRFSNATQERINRSLENWD